MPGCFFYATQRASTYAHTATIATATVTVMSRRRLMPSLRQDLGKHLRRILVVIHDQHAQAGFLGAHGLGEIRLRRVSVDRVVRQPNDEFTSATATVAGSAD